MTSLRSSTLVGVASFMLMATTNGLREHAPMIGGAENVHCPSAAFGAADLRCTPLIPTPDLERVAAVLELIPEPSPFGVSVTVDGHPRQHLRATVAGLPAPRSLGAYSVYVAWAYTLTLDREVKLGIVGNGGTELGELDYNQFRILVTAERSAEVGTRTGRLVLRGTSPSARLMAHRDMFAPSAPGALQDSVARTLLRMQDVAHAGAEHGGAAQDSTQQPWPMPPMSSNMASMAALAGLTPRVAPFRPGAGVDPATLSAVRRRETVVMRDGDTIALEAQLVRTTIGGRDAVMYAYNGEQPGPLIEVDQGATITVHFSNSIDMPGAVHWHGVRLDNRFDGVPGLTQPLIEPGGRSTYRVHFRDPGIYWYHPHYREDIQQDLGLYGNIRVRSSDPAYYAPANREETLMLDDLLSDGSELAPHGADAPTYALMGRFGNVFLVNGEPAYALSVDRGEVVRFFLTNAASARPFNLSFGGARMKLVAGDGGRFEHEEWVSSVVIAPAERYVVDVEFARSGPFALVNQVQALDHMRGTFSLEADTLGIVRVSDVPARPSYARSFARLRQNAGVSADIGRLRRYFAKPVDHTIELTLRTRALPAAVSNMLWGINTAVDWNDGMPMMNWITSGKEVAWVLRDPQTGRENMDIAWSFLEGQIAKLRFVNDPSASHAMDHPIHLHGQRFLVLSRGGVRNENLVWKDTAIIPAGETVDVLVEMSNPGRWMMHCHIAEHLSAGMMAVFTVVPTAHSAGG